jgi:hypothetical protein
MAGVDTVNAGPLTAMDVSPSGEMMCFGDADGGLYLWADRNRTCVHLLLSFLHVRARAALTRAYGPRSVAWVVRTAGPASAAALCWRVRHARVYRRVCTQVL